MYKNKVDFTAESFVLTASGERIPFDYRQYIWHGQLMDSAHPTLRRDVLDAFVGFLVERKEIHTLSGGRGAYVVIDARYRTNNGPWQSLSSSQELP